MTVRWPEHPYKGLSYYGPTDVLLFAGRKNDVDRIARQLAHPSARILILHGRTGCGKSSFLRAGLIPFLERPEHGYQFLKAADANEAGTSAIFIKSGDKPLAKLAEELFAWGGRQLVNETPVGSTTIDLSPVRLGHEQLDEFVEDVGSSGERMVESLGKLARLLPRTLIIVTDQAEEVITLRSDPSGDEARSHFFDFLATFATSRMDLKLLIALRSEYYAEFDSEIRRRQWNTENIQQEQLLVLDELEITRAIERPTQHEGYGFVYEQGLPARIASDLVRTVPKGGALPVMQIVCKRLYDMVKARSGPNRVTTVTVGDYESLGGVEQQVDMYLQEVLRKLCAQTISGAVAEVEIDKWYEVLNLLVRYQVDGTATKIEETVEELTRQSRSLGCRVPFQEAMDFLSDWRIVQKTQVRNIQTDELHDCYTLGHDTIGLALQAWRQRGEGREQVGKRLKRASLITGLSFVVIALVGFGLDYALDWVSIENAIWGVLAANSAVYLLLALAPMWFLQRFVLRFFPLRIAARGHELKTDFEK